MEIIKTGDWLQATEEITEEDFMGEAVWIHARKGGVGHALSEAEGVWVNVFWERTGTVTLCHVSEVKRLGAADVGKTTLP